MAKMCPLMAIALFGAVKNPANPLDVMTPRNQDKISWSSATDCNEEFCQMWDEAKKDCGLKHSPANPPVNNKPSCPKEGFDSEPE